VKKSPVGVLTKLKWKEVSMEWLTFVIGVVVGALITSVIYYVIRVSGTLRIDRTDPDRDIYRLELGDLDKLAKKKRVLLKVDTHANLAQK
jgi:hypothetical protein